MKITPSARYAAHPARQNADVRLRFMRRKWWKAYFFLALALTLVVLALPFLVDESRETPWWEWMYVPLYVVQIVGLFGFVFWRRLGVPPVWQVVFLASIAYEIWDLFSMATDPDLKTTDHAGFLMTMVAATLVLQVPMLVGLFLYGFRCKELWHGAT
jgi:hypothetical protein